MSWTRVLDAAELIEQEPRAVQLEGRDLCVLRSGGEVFAFDDACPHRQWPLHLGHVEGKTLTCRAHTWQWDVASGELLRIRAPECLTVHRARERDGAIEVSLDPDAPAPRALSPLWLRGRERELTGAS